MYRPRTAYDWIYRSLPLLGASGYLANTLLRSRQRHAPYNSIPRTYGMSFPTPSNHARPIYRSSARGRPTISRGGMVSELNFKDSTFSNVAVNSTGSFTLLNGMATGSSGQTRLGRKILVKSVQPRISFQADTAATYNHVRMIIFVDRQANGSAPSVTDLLAAASPQAMLNLDNSRRFRVLMDRSFPLIGNSTTPSNSQEGVIVDEYRKVNVYTTYNSGSVGDITDIETGSLYCLLLGSQAAGTGDAGATGYIRIRFHPLL